MHQGMASIPQGLLLLEMGMQWSQWAAVVPFVGRGHRGFTTEYTHPFLSMHSVGTRHRVQ